MSWHPLEELSQEQREKLHAYAAMLREMNRSINLVSREDEERLFERHILHSLSLTFRKFPAGSTVVDWGTGGGLPAVPLAIAFSDVRIHAVDSVRKKVQAVRTMARRLGLENLDTWHGRAEAYPGDADFSVSRATASLSVLWSWHARVAVGRAGTEEAGETAPDGSLWHPGLICLKGGDIANEITDLQRSEPHVHIQNHPLADISPAAYGTPNFAGKMIVECRAAEVN